MRKRKTMWRRTLMTFLLIGTILVQMIAEAGVAEAMQVAAKETETKIGGGPEESVTGENMEAVELTDKNRYKEEFNGQPEPRYSAAEGRSRAAVSLEDYIVDEIKGGKTTIDVSAYRLPVSESGEIIKILNNHPELFYMKQRYGYLFGEDEIITQYQLQYKDGMTKDQIAEMSADMETAAEKAAACAEPGMEPYEKALAVHDYLIQNCKYDYANYLAGKVPDISHTAYGALVEGTAVCDGYAGAYLYIMRDKLGIDCRIVTSDEMKHAWNMIEIDGNWYHVDVTWDDPAWDSIGGVCHDNFLLSDDKISAGSKDAPAPSGKNHYAWSGDTAADSDTYDEAFWTDVRSAICSHNGGWYYSKFQKDGNSVATAVKLVKRETFLDGEEKVVDTAPAWSASETGYWTSSFMFVAKSGDYLYYNTPTEIRRLKEDGSAYGVFSLKEALGEKQIFGFTMKDGDFLYVPYENYVLDEEQTDIQTVAAADADFKIDEGSRVSNPTAGKWSYIYFGTYPQTEVTGADLTNAIKNASYDTNGDAVVDGVKYRRIYTVRSTPDEKKDQYLYFKWEPIRWRVLQKTDDTLFVMSDIGLDNIPYGYGTSTDSVVWEESRMRSWLNDDDGTNVYEPDFTTNDSDYEFYSYVSQEESSSGKVFIRYPNTEDQEKVHSFYMTAFDKEQWSAITAQGDDKIFLLSSEDVKNASYGFGTADKLPARILQVSEYAHRKGAYYFGSISSRLASWWLRPDSASPATAQGVSYDGSIKNFSAGNNQIVSVPAMYISIDSDQWVSEETMLQQEKDSAKETLENYRTAGCYRKAERKTWTETVADGKTAIEQAKSMSAVREALKTAIAKIDTIKTDADYRAEERGDIEAMDLNPEHHCNEDGDKDTTDWKYIYFGSCPQTKVTDEELIEQLNSTSHSTSTDLSEVVELNGEKYSCIYSGWWYKWEPIKWRILQSEEDTLFVAADLPVGLQNYYDIYSTPVLNEEFLNGTFLDHAFSAGEKEAIVPMSIDGKESSVYLLSYEEATNDQYGFCTDGTKASASRRIETTEYMSGLGGYWAAMGGQYRMWSHDGWWLRGEMTATGDIARPLRLVFGKKQSETKGEGSIDVVEGLDLPSNGNIYAATPFSAHVVPALRVSKSSGYWSFEPVSGSNDPEVVEQAVESAKNQLETGYSEDDYSEEAWANVLAAIEAAKKELEDAVYTSDVTGILDRAKEEIAGILTKEQEKLQERLNGIKNPKHSHVLTDGAVAEGDEDKDVTEWSYVYFGSYPQSEVTDKKITDAIDAAIEAGEADAFDTGEESSYMEIYDAEIRGSKYRRLKITRIGEGNDVITTYYKWEPIKWKVLQIEEEEKSLYLMADQKLEYRQMDSTDETGSWRDSDLRDWLNQDFYAAAFSGDEQKAVVTQQVQYPDADYVNGKDEEIFTEYTTDDKVYLLSYNELFQEKYGFCPLHDNRGNGNSRSVSSRRQTQTDYQKGLVKALPGLPRYLFDGMMSGKVNEVLETLREDYLYSETNTIDDVRRDEGRGQHTWTRSPGEYIPGSSYTPGSIAKAEQLFIARTFNYGYVCPAGENQYAKYGVVPVLHVDVFSDLWKTELDLKKDAAKAELAAYKEDDSAYPAQQLEQCKAVLEEGNKNIQKAEDETEIADALQAAKDRLDDVLTIGELKLEEWQETHPGTENIANPVAAENPQENSAAYSYVYFGSYPQSRVTDEVEESAVEAVMADKENGEDAWVEVDGVKMKYRKYGVFYFRWEPIKWRVLQKKVKGSEETSSLLLMADNGLDVKKFNESGDAEWKDSTLREWLTGDFYNEAFNLTQQEALISPIQKDDWDYIAGDRISLPSYGDLLKEEYGFGPGKEKLKSRIVSPSGYASMISFNASMWWQSSTVDGYDTGNVRLTARDGSANLIVPGDFSYACVPIIRVKLFEDGTYALNPGEIKAGQSAVEEITERIEQCENAVSDYNEEDREALQTAIGQAKETIENAKGDVEAAKGALAALEAVFAEKTESMRTQIQAELARLGQEINSEDYYEAQQEEIAQVLEQAGKAIADASDVKTMRKAMVDAKTAMEGIKTKADVDAEAGQKELSDAKAQAKKELEAFLTDEKKALYREAEWETLTETVGEAMREVDNASTPDAVQAVLAKAKTAVAAIKTDAQWKEEEKQPDDPKETDNPKPTDNPKATDEPKPTDNPKPTDEPKATDNPDATDNPKPTGNPNATDNPKPTGSPNATDNPKPTDNPKATDSPNATDNPKTPGVSETPDDPDSVGLKKGDSVIKGNLKFVLLDPNQKTVSVEGVASAKAKKFAVNIPPTVVINGSECKVTEVRKKGFAKFAKITKVSLGKNITKVGKSAFDGCTAITSLTVKGDVKTFDSKSFNGCKKLKTIDFKGKKVPAFKSGAFKGTASKVKVKLAKKMSDKDKIKMKSKLKKAGVKKVR